MSAASLINYPSPWPLPKFIYGYSSYVYTQEWSSVILTFYLFKILYVFIYYLDDGNHPEWFDGLGNVDVTSGTSFVPSLASVVVGDFIFLLIGMLLGWVQSCVIDSSLFYFFVEGFKFNTVEDWKKYFKETREFHGYGKTKKIGKNKIPTDVPVGAPSCYDGIVGWGAWPPINIFACGFYPDDYFYRYCCCCCKHDEDDYDHENPSLENEDDAFGLKKKTKYDAKHLEYVKRLKWAHRRFYWFYFLQAVLLGTPATVVYTVGANEDVRSGTIVYYLVQLFLLTVFYFWNKIDHRKIVSFFESGRNQEERSIEESGWKSKFNATYVSWLVTITFFSALVVVKIGVNVSLIIIYAWAFSMVVWFTIYLSNYVTDRVYEDVKKLIL